jgi:biotin carboxyl carrier protein
MLKIITIGNVRVWLYVQQLLSYDGDSNNIIEVSKYLCYFKFSEPTAGLFLLHLYTMLKAKVNNKTEYSIELKDASSGVIDGTPFTWDVLKVKNGSFHIIKDDKSYNVEIVKTNVDEKTFVINVNGNNYEIQVKDKYDALLKNLGLDNLNAKKVNEIKAPMPGMVLDLRVEVGSVVKKGDPILVLEAMKMENIIKSPTDGIVSKINVKKGVAVEKNQLLINFS